MRMLTHLCRQLFLLVPFLSLSFGEVLDNSDRDLQIAIIGAGPSGLTAAVELKERGYNNVTILEAGKDIGGKVQTVTYNGLPYEMGAVVTAPDYKLVLKIAKDLKIPLAATPNSLEISPDGALTSQDSYIIEKYGRIELLLSIYRFSSFVYTNRHFYEPGFAHTPAELLTTYEDFAKQQNVEATLEAFRPVMVGCGYGFAEDMPAAYWAKLMKTFVYEYSKHALNPFAPPFFRAFPEGWQNLWKQWAKEKDLNVFLDAKVSRIRRTMHQGKPDILIRVGDQTLHFDRVIISVPHLAKHWMDLDKQEYAIFSKVHTIPYKVSLVEIENLPQNFHLWPRAYSTKYDNNQEPNDGKIVLVSNNQNNNIYQVYQFSQEGKNSDTLRNIMFENLSQMKGKVTRVITEVMYSYFPHFDTQAFVDQIPQKLSDLQGSRGAYYTGALMNFETVELAAEHAQWLVQEYFK